MTVQCADCKGYYCLGGKLEASPDNCPMRGDFPSFEELYSQGRTLELLTRSASVEAQGYCKWTRLEEVAEFSKLMGFHRIGTAHCPDMAAVASSIGTKLEDQGFEVILPHPSLLGDPEDQAEFFKEEATDLNLLCGMCVAHEVQFLDQVETPTVSLIARDVRLRHNPAAGLYTSRSYLKAELFGHWPREERLSSAGRGREDLGSLSCGGDTGPAIPRSRVAEALYVAHGIGAQHIGLSFCVGFKEEAKTLAGLLKANGFQVSSVCCKTGAVPKEEAGIPDAEKVRPGTVEMVCNPLAQAELLNREKVQFAMVLGQCVGHDAATLQHLEAPATCIVAKDRVLAHNTVAALYAP